MPDMLDAKAHPGYLDKNHLESALDHAGYKRKLRLLPEIRQGCKLETRTDVLDAEALVVGQDGTRRDCRSFRVCFLKKSSVEAPRWE